MRAALLAVVLVLPAAARAGGPGTRQADAEFLGSGDSTPSPNPTPAGPGDDSGVCPVPTGPDGKVTLESIMSAPLPGEGGRRQPKGQDDAIVVTATPREHAAEPATVGVDLTKESMHGARALPQPQPGQNRPQAVAPPAAAAQNPQGGPPGTVLGGMMRGAGSVASTALGWLRGGRGGAGGAADGAPDGGDSPAPGGATRTEQAAQSQARALSTLNAVGGQLVGESAAMQTDGVGGGGAGPGGAGGAHAMPGHGGPGGIPGGFTGLESTSILARGRMRRALADEGLTGTMRDGQPDLRGPDGRPATKEQLDALLRRYKNEPAALNTRPDFLSVLPPSHYDELRRRFPRDAKDPAAPAYRGLALAGGKDFLWASGPRRGEEVSPEALEGVFRALPRLPGAEPEQSVPGTPVAEADPAQADTIQVAPGTEGYQVTGLKADALERQPQTGGVYAGGFGRGRRAEEAELDVVGRGLAVKSVPAAAVTAAEEPLPVGKIVAGGAAFGFLIAAGLLALRRRG
jgi:hypothetical protein